MNYRTAVLTFSILCFGLSTVSAQTEKPLKSISGGVLNNKASSLPLPAYPSAARAVGVRGTVNVKVEIDEQGNIVSATAVSGHPLLRQAAEQAATEAKFNPTFLSGQPVSVSGVLVYNFAGSSNESSEKSAINQEWLIIGNLLGISERNGIRVKTSLPAEFASEQEQLNRLVKLSPEEQKTQVPAILSVIKSKLNAADSWRFEFGLAKGRIYGNFDDENSILLNLAKFKKLALNKAEGIQEDEINNAVELAKIADKRNLTPQDKKSILNYLK